MSYLFGAGLQARIYERLAGDATLSGLVGAAIHDAPLKPGPEGAARDYVTLGEETVRANDTKTSAGAIHDFTVTVHSARDVRRGEADRRGGLRLPRRCAARGRGGRLVALRFLRAGRAGPGPEKRKISRFRAVVDAAD